MPVPAVDADKRGDAYKKVKPVIATVYSVMSAGHVYSVMSLTVYSVV